MIGLTGQVEAPTLVVETEEDLDQIDFTRPIYFLSQTTQSISLFQHLCDRMRSRATDPAQVFAHDTICRQVSNRESHLEEFAGRFDVIIFVCGRKSSNGRVLSKCVAGPIPAAITSKRLRSCVPNGSKEPNPSVSAALRPPPSG